MQKQAQKQEFLFHRENGLDTRRSEATTNASRSEHFLFLVLALVLASTFSLENRTRSWRPTNVLELVFLYNQPKHSFSVCSWFYQDGRGWTKFEERVSEMVCQFPVTVFIRLRDTRSLCSVVSALVYLPCPHQSFVATSDFFWCQLFLLFIASTSFSLCFLILNCFVQSGNQDRNWQWRDLAGVCFVTYLHQNSRIKEIVSHMKHYFRRAGLILSEHFIVSPNNIHQLNIHVKRMVLVVHRTTKLLSLGRPTQVPVIWDNRTTVKVEHCFWSPPQLILTPPFINFRNFLREYNEVHKYIIDSWCFLTISGSAIY